MKSEEEKKQFKIEEIKVKLHEIYPKWLFLAVRLQNKIYSTKEEEIKLSKEWNLLDNSQASLYKDLRTLQTEYQVEHFDIKGHKVTSLLLLNLNVEINTYENGWQAYENNIDVILLLQDVFNILNSTFNKVEICQMSKLN